MPTSTIERIASWSDSFFDKPLSDDFRHTLWYLMVQHVAHACEIDDGDSRQGFMKALRVAVYVQGLALLGLTA
jgi:hypothetical protein